MASAQRTLPLNSSFTGGVTQQGNVFRRLSQVARQENAWSSLVDGVAKRHGTEHVGLLFTDHGGPSLCEFVGRGDRERYAFVFSDGEIRAFDHKEEKSYPVVPKGGAGPTDFSYLSCRGVELYTITSSLDLAGVNVTTSAGKNGLATSKTVSAAGGAIGPYGGLLQLRGFSADTTAGHWFAWVVAGTGGANARPGWNTVELFVKQGSQSPHVGIAIYNDTAGAFVAAATFAFSGSDLSETPVYVVGSEPNVRATSEHVGGSWHRLILRYKAQIAHAMSFGPYFGQDASGPAVVLAGIRLDSGTEDPRGSFFVPPIEAIRMRPRDDHFFVVNRTKTVAMDSDVSLTKVFGALLKLTGTLTDGSQWNLTINGVTKNFEWNTTGGLGSDADPTYFVDATGTLTAAASNLAQKLNLVFGQGVAHAMGANVSVTYAAGVTVTVAETGDASNAMSSAVLDEQAMVHVRSVTYDDTAWMQWKQGTYKLRIAATVTTALGGTPTGPARCVNGTGGALAACSASNGHLGVWIPAANRTVGITPDDVTRSLLGFALSGLTATASAEEDGYGIEGVTGSVPFVGAKNTMVDREGGVLRILSGEAIDAITVDDSSGGESLILVNGTVDRETDLPTHALHGTRILVKGIERDKIDDKYVRAITEAGYGFAKCRWEQSTDYNVPTTIDAATFPHQLERRQDDGSGTITGIPFAFYFELDYMNLSTRNVGNEELNPDPSFIGRTIQDLVFAHGRLCLVTPEHFVASEANANPVDGFNFFLTGTSVVIDSDPIDKGASAEASANHLRSSTLHSIVPFQDRIFLFSDTAVFVVDGRPTFTPESASINVLHETNQDRIAHPVATQHSILYAFRRGAYSGVSELFFSEEAASTRPVWITEHVERFIPGSIVQIAVSTEQKCALFFARDDPTALYVYKWDRSTDTHNVAFHRYSFGAPIIGAGVVDSDVLLVQRRATGTFLQRMPLGNGLLEPDGTWLCRLDRQVRSDSAGVYQAFSSPNTNVTVPFTIDPADTIEAYNHTTGAQLTVVSATPGGTTVVLAGDQSAVDLRIGVPYTMEVELNRPKIVRDEGAVLPSRIQVTRAWLSYEESSAFDVLVETKTGGVKTLPFVAPSKASDQVGTVLPYRDTGRFEIAVNSRAEEAKVTLRSTFATPCRFLKAEFDAAIDAT